MGNSIASMTDRQAVRLYCQRHGLECSTRGAPVIASNGDRPAYLQAFDSWQDARAALSAIECAARDGARRPWDAAG